MTLPVKKVGKTDIAVTRLSLGGSSFGNLGGVVTDQAVTDVLTHAWNAGIRYFDTAPHYGRGLSEMRMGQFLNAKSREDYVISSKVGRVLSPGPQLQEADGFINPLPNAVRYDYSHDGIMESFEGSCERLGTSKIEIIFVHDIGEDTHAAADNERHMEALLGSGFEALHKLKQAGRVNVIGLGVNECQVCLDVMAHEALDVILLAGRLTLMDREAEKELLDVCTQQGTSLVLGGILNSGILATGPKPGAWFNYAPAPDHIMQQAGDLQDKAKAVGLTLPQAAVQFAVRHPAACSVLLGTGKVTSLQRNLDAAALELSQEALTFVTA
jgi:D-threo-aldose 1-dehydrogenase